MISKRKLISSLLGSKAGRAVWRRHNKKYPPRLTIVTYHRIIHPSKIGSANREVVSAAPDAFRKQMLFIKKYFTPINFFDLSAILRKDKAIPQNPIIITFDDGYKDNYDFAFPVLRELKLKAVIFLATGFIGTQKKFWWDEISSILFRMDKTEISLPAFSNKPIEIPSSAERNSFIENFLDKIKVMPDSKKNLIIEELRRNAKKNNFSSGSSAMMDWDMVLEMRKSGVEIGAHTLNHPILSQIDNISLKKEIEVSVKMISEKTGVQPISFCYPVGRLSSFNNRVISELKKNGLLFAVTLIHGVNYIANFDSFQMKRLNIHYLDSIVEYKAKLLFPGIIKY